MKRLSMFLGVFLLTAAVAPAQEQEAPLQLTWDRTGPAGTVLIRNATIWTQDEAGTLENADLLMRDGVIAAVGTGLDVPSGATVLDGAGLHVTPGLIDAHSHTGAAGINEASENITAEVRIEDVLEPDQGNIYQQLAGGTTAAQILHGSANAIGGQSALVKWRYGVEDAHDLLIEGATPHIKFALGENPKRSAFSLPIPGLPQRYPGTRMGVANSIRRAFLAARDYQAEWAAYEALSEAERARTAPPRRDLRLETLVEIMEGERLVTAHSYRQDEIIMLIRVAEEMGFQIGAFTHVLEGYKASHEIAAHGAGASTFADWWGYKFEVYDAIPYNGAMMHDDGVVVSFNSDSGELARHLNVEAAKAVRFGGLSDEEALAFVTSNPARQLRLFDRLGSLTEGKDADVVVWNGHPLSVYSRVEMTFVDGRKVFDRELDLQMREARAAEKARLVAAIEDDDSESEEGAEGEDPAEEAAEGTAAEDDSEAEENAEEPYRFADVPDRDYAPWPLGQDGAVAVIGATVHTVSGEPIENGVVVFENGVITAVGGSDTAIPPGAERVKASGRHLWPGMIAADSDVGLIEIGNGAPGTVDTSEIDRFNPDIRAEVAVNVGSEHIPVTRMTGVLYTLTIPRGGTLTGYSALLRMDGWSWEEMTALSHAGLHLMFPGGGGGFGFFGPPPSDEDIARQRREALDDVDELLAAAEAYARAQEAAVPGVRHEHDVKLAGLVPVVRGEVPLIVHTNGARDIRAALEWAAGHELHVVILDRGDTWRAAEDLAAANVPVILAGTLATPPHADDPYDAMYANAALLHEAGVEVTIANSQGTGSDDDRTLPWQAGMAAAFGLPRDVAVRAVTLNPARALGLGDELGSIEVGKTASLVLTDGDLLEVRSQVVAQWIDGRPVDTESRHTRLWKQWRDRPLPGGRD